MAASPGCRPQDRRWAEIRNWDSNKKAEARYLANLQAESDARAEQRRVWAEANPTAAWWSTFFTTLFVTIPGGAVLCVIGFSIWLMVNAWLWVVGTLLSLIMMLVPMTFFPGAMEFWGICAMLGGVVFTLACNGAFGTNKTV